MNLLHFPGRNWLRSCGIASLALTSLLAQVPAPPAEPDYDLDTKALLLARSYLEGDAGARPAVLEALRLMGWGVRDAKGAIVQAAPAGTDTGLAFRDYELDELLKSPGERPSLRFISFAQALAVPFEQVDPEELAQNLVESIRKSAESAQPQERFWARFIVALGRISPADYDLTKPGPAAVIPPDPKRLQKLAEGGLAEFARNQQQLAQAMAPTPLWPDDDPVLAASPLPRDYDRSAAARTSVERDRTRMDEISVEMERISTELSSGDPVRQAAAQERMRKLNEENIAISQRMAAASQQQMSTMLKRMQGGNADADDEPRFLAEWRDQPLLMLQVALIARVLSADLRRPDPLPPRVGLGRGAGRLPLASILVAQAGGPPTTFGGQFSGAAGDIWATGWGGYTGLVLERNLPNSKFAGRVAIANAVIAWLKTALSVLQQKITLEVDNAPLVRTKTRQPGEQRTARAKVEIDFPSGDTLKAIRAAMNLTTLDLQLPDGGPISGAKVVWRLPEGSEGSKYQTKGGGWAYKPELAVVQFAQRGSNAAYISYTNDAGEATITIEGKPQRKNLSKTVRPYPRRAMVAVEVTIKVGNLTQDLTDAINIAMGGPVLGGLTFVADMFLRTSFLFQKGRVFQVQDWKEPAWEGEFEITIAGSGAKRVPGIKGGPETEIAWKMDRRMQGRLHTPDWEEDAERERNYANYARHILEVDGDSRYFRLNDSSSARSRSVNNRYEAVGPIQIQPPGRNQLEIFSRAEPSGTAVLTFTGGIVTLDLEPFFGALCIVGRFERSGSRSSSKSGPEYLSLMGGLMPERFSIVAPGNYEQETVSGSQTYDYKANLPYVPAFDVKVTVKYDLWKNGPPPKGRLD